MQPDRAAAPPLRRAAINADRRRPRWSCEAVSAERALSWRASPGPNAAQVPVRAAPQPHSRRCCQNAREPIWVALTSGLAAERNPTTARLRTQSTRATPNGPREIRINAARPGSGSALTSSDMWTPKQARSNRSPSGQSVAMPTGSPSNGSLVSTRGHRRSQKVPSANVGIDQGGIYEIEAGPNGIGQSARTTNRAWKIDPDVARVVAVIPVNHPPADVAVGAGAVWIASDDGTLSRPSALPRILAALGDRHIGDPVYSRSTHRRAARRTSDPSRSRDDLQLLLPRARESCPPAARVYPSAMAGRYLSRSAGESRRESAVSRRCARASNSLIPPQI